MPPLPRKKRPGIANPLTNLPEDVLAALSSDFGDFEVEAAKASYLIRGYVAIAEQRSSTWLAWYGLTPRLLQILIWLYASNSGKGVKTAQIGPFINTAGAKLTVALDVLEEKGLIRRRLNADDRRSIVVQLTPRGRELFRKAFATHAHYFLTAFSALSIADRRRLGELLRLVVQAFEAIQPVQRIAAATRAKSSRERSKQSKTSASKTARKRR